MRPGKAAGPTGPIAPAKTVEPPAGGAMDGAPRWVSGLLAGAQAALMSVLVVAVPALAAYVATSADPSNADVGWPQSVAIGAALWLLAHGAVLRAGEITVTLVPLGLTLLALFSCYASARRSAHPTRSAWLAAIGGYLVVAAAVVALAGPAGPLGAGAGSLVRTAVGTVLVAGAGLGAGLVRVRRLRERTRRWWSRVHTFWRSGVVAGAMAVATVVGVAAAVTCTWVIAGRAAAGDVIEGLGVDMFGGLLLAVAQVAVLPNLVLWAMAWLVGPGFSVGAGTLYSPAVVVGGPLPALPLLGALPAGGDPDGPLTLAPLVVVGAGVLAGWWLHRRVPTGQVWHPFALAAVAALSAGVLTAVLTALAGGSVGPGRLADVGGAPLLVGVVAAGLTLAGALLGAVPGDVVVQAAVARWVRGAWVRVRRRPAAEPAVEVGSSEERTDQA